MNLTTYISYVISTLVDMLTSAPLNEFFALVLACAVIRIVVNFVHLNTKKSEV